MLDQSFKNRNCNQNWVSVRLGVINPPMGGTIYLKIYTHMITQGMINYQSTSNFLGHIPPNADMVTFSINCNTYDNPLSNPKDDETTHLKNCTAQNSEFYNSKEGNMHVSSPKTMPRSLT